MSPLRDGFGLVAAFLLLDALDEVIAYRLLILRLVARVAHGSKSSGWILAG